MQCLRIESPLFRFKRKFIRQVWYKWLQTCYRGNITVFVWCVFLHYHRIETIRSFFAINTIGSVI